MVKKMLALGMGVYHGGEYRIVIDKPVIDLDKHGKELGQELVTRRRQCGPLRFKLRDKAWRHWLALVATACRMR